MAKASRARRRAAVIADIDLMMECVDDELSPCQRAANKAAQLAYDKSLQDIKLAQMDENTIVNACPGTYVPPAPRIPKPLPPPPPKQVVTSPVQKVVTPTKPPADNSDPDVIIIDDNISSLPPKTLVKQPGRVVPGQGLVLTSSMNQVRAPILLPQQFTHFQMVGGQLRPQNVRSNILPGVMPNTNQILNMPKAPNTMAMQRFSINQRSRVAEETSTSPTYQSQTEDKLCRPACKLNCRKNFSSQDREQIYKDFWKGGSCTKGTMCFQTRTCFVFNGKKVCKKFFIGTLMLPEADFPSNYRASISVRDHVNSYPTRDGTCLLCKARGLKFLSADLKIQKMYLHYAKTKNRNAFVSAVFYRRIFKTHFGRHRFMSESTDRMSCLCEGIVSDINGNVDEDLNRIKPAVTGQSVPGTFGLGIKRAHAEVEPETIKVKRIRRVPDQGNQAANWVPLDEYYYGKKEGDPAYREEKGEFRFKCWYCHKMLYNNLRVMMHMQGHIDSEKQQNLDLSDLTQCKHCYKQFDTPFEMQCHIEKVHQNNTNVLVCRICEKDHENQTVLRTHMRTNHTSCEMPYICQLCNFRSSVYSDVVDHFKKRHDSSEYVLCLYCLRAFKINFSKANGWGLTQNYYQHLQKHQIKNSLKKCPCCKLTFLNKVDAKNHRARDHLANHKGILAGGSASTGPSNPTDKVMINVTEKGLKGNQPKSLNAPTHSKVQEYSSISFVSDLTGYACMECKGQMLTHNHFRKYVECTMCRFATTCSHAYANHMISFHSGRQVAPQNIAIERPMDKFMFCWCGYSSKYGNSIANHLIFCSKRTCYTSKPELRYIEYEDVEDFNPFEPYETDEPDPEPEPVSTERSLFDVLGLVKRQNVRAPTPPTKTEPEKAKKEEIPPELTGDRKWATVKIKDPSTPTKGSIFLGSSKKETAEPASGRSESIKPDLKEISKGEEKEEISESAQDQNVDMQEKSVADKDVKEIPQDSTELCEGQDARSGEILESKSIPGSSSNNETTISNTEESSTKDNAEDTSVDNPNENTSKSYLSRDKEICESESNVETADSVIDQETKGNADEICEKLSDAMSDSECLVKDDDSQSSTTKDDIRKQEQDEEQRETELETCVEMSEQDKSESSDKIQETQDNGMSIDDTKDDVEKPDDGMTQTAEESMDTTELETSSEQASSGENLKNENEPEVNSMDMSDRTEKVASNDEQPEDKPPSDKEDERSNQDEIEELAPTDAIETADVSDVTSEVKMSQEETSEAVNNEAKDERAESEDKIDAEDTDADTPSVSGDQQNEKVQSDQDTSEQEKNPEERESEAVNQEEKTSGENEPEDAENAAEDAEESAADTEDADKCSAGGQVPSPDQSQQAVKEDESKGHVAETGSKAEEEAETVRDESNTQGQEAPPGVETSQQGPPVATTGTGDKSESQAEAELSKTSTPDVGAGGDGPSQRERKKEEALPDTKKPTDRPTHSQSHQKPQQQSPRFEQNKPYNRNFDNRHGNQNRGSPNNRFSPRGGGPNRGGFQDRGRGYDRGGYGRGGFDNQRRGGYNDHRGYNQDHGNFYRNDRGHDRGRGGNRGHNQDNFYNRRGNYHGNYRGRGGYY